MMNNPDWRLLNTKKGQLNCETKLLQHLYKLNTAKLK